uniref:t-SNARE coiled-coil homology domain-containing protein n=1 Tax=Monopterus albus TaxID=43700 RepID=A0A3Q3KPK8_MONAL
MVMELLLNDKERELTENCTYLKCYVLHKNSDLFHVDKRVFLTLSLHSLLFQKIADRSKALLPTAQKDRKKSPLTPSREQLEDGSLFGEAADSEGGVQALLAEISEEDVEVLHHREEALLQIERDMLDVNQIMKDLAHMVHEQGVTIDSIEDYIQTGSSNVESANQELAKANQYQVK